MGVNATNLLYLVTIVTFILALRFLSNPATARRGNWIGAVGMLIAIVVTFLQNSVVSFWEIAVGMVIGGAFGAVAAMRPGSVIVDLAAETGGNCELTVPGEVVVREDVTIVGYTNVASMMPFHASQLYSRNVLALLQHLAPDGELKLDWEDEITSAACVTRKEEVAA